jgi:hypothetical protein
MQVGGLGAGVRGGRGDSVTEVTKVAEGPEEQAGARACGVEGRGGVLTCVAWEQREEGGSVGQRFGG